LPIRNQQHLNLRKSTYYTAFLKQLSNAWQAPDQNAIIKNTLVQLNVLH